MNIYVGNLSYEVTEEDLKQAFEEFGQVSSVNIVKDRYSGRSRGFGFVDMPGRDEAQSAIKGMGGRALKGRSLNVDEARPRSRQRKEGGWPSGGGRGGWGRSY